MRGLSSCFSSFWEKLILKMSPLLLRETLGVFLNTLATEGEYPIEDWQKLSLPMQMQLSETRQIFSQFCCSLYGLCINFKAFWTKNMIEIPQVFPKLQTVKILVRALYKNRYFRKRFQSQHVKVSQILVKSPSEHLSHLSSAFWAKLIWKMSPLVLGKIFGALYWHIACRCQVPCWTLREFATPNSNVIIWKTKSFFWIYCWISGIYIKFQTFWKKRWWS